jgi:glycosyltransferase involved in cell wall biosynthesis
MVHIAVVMMVKNEKKRLHVTLESVKNFADSLVIFDTGSTDNTIQICQNFCEKNKIFFRLKEGLFVNFSESRNVLLDFANSFEDIDYMLLMDCNDELVEGELLRKIAERDEKSETLSYLIRQEWYTPEIYNYFNVRFIRAHKEWKFSGVVHEYITLIDNGNVIDTNLKSVKVDKKIKLYQDRTQDDDKSGKRFLRDKELLLEEHKKNQKEPRTVFYLAQTYSCLNDKENAYYYYKLRTSLGGFWEEVYHAYAKCGTLSEYLNHDWYESFAWYMKAYEHTPRVEPLIKIAEHYNNNKQFLLAFIFLELACKLKFPEHCNLFIDKLAYEYTRWHLMGIVAYYAHEYLVGKISCLKAIENGKLLSINTEIDQRNLQFYIDKEEENSEISNDITKKKFIENKISELRKTNSKLSEKQMMQISKLQWKNRKC